MANVTVTNLWSTAQAITMTLASLATSANAGRESTLLTSANYPDGSLHLRFGIGTGGNCTADGIKVFLHGATSATGSNLVQPCTGTDAAITFQSTGTPTNLIYAGMLNCLATATAYDFYLHSIALCFGGNMPVAWGVVVNNAGGSTFTGTEAAFTKEWLPLTQAIG